MAETAIEWATHVYNPFTGCDRVTPGCAHCYALTMAKRLKAMGNVRYQNDGDGRASGPGFGFTVHWDKLTDPPRFPAGARVFVNSMSDVFHEEAPYAAIAALFDVCSAQPSVDFLILTKRPERMKMVVTHVASDMGGPLPNVWLGVTIENRRFVQRADLLRETPAAVRFVSAEPLLGPLLYDDRSAAGCYATGGMAEGGLEIVGDTTIWQPHWHDDFEGDELDLDGIDWLIAGGESGAGARRCDEAWLRDLRDACEASGTAFFLKQLGAVLARERGVKGKGGEDEAALDGRRHVEMPTSMVAQA